MSCPSVHVQSTTVAFAHFENDCGPTVVVEAPITVVQILDVGIPGPAGGVGVRHIHNQSSALNPWVVNHNLGQYPAVVTVKSPGGVEVVAEVVHTSVNQCIISFGMPYAGSAIIL